MSLPNLFRQGRNPVRPPWCAICAKPVPTFWTSARMATCEIEIVSSCHGLDSTIVLDQLAITDRRYRAVVAFKLAPKMLQPIAPPRRRGRPLPPEDAGRIVVHLAGPM